MNEGFLIFQYITTWTARGRETGKEAEKHTVQLDTLAFTSTEKRARVKVQNC
jgi:hypothetical protein